MIARNYSVRVLNRGEDLLYSDAEGELQLQQTYFDGHRLYCKDTSGDGFGPPIPFERRKRLIENLCDHFDTRHRTSIFVLGSRDKDRDRLEALFEELRELGHRIIVEHDGARGRKASRDALWIETLRRNAMSTVAVWHQIVASHNPLELGVVLAENVVLHSPVVHRPITGQPMVRMYLTAALQVFANDSFRYVREVVGERDAVLEFETVIDGITVNGVDMIRWDDAGRIVDFKVMVRPLKAINLIHQKMAALVGGKPAGA